MASKCKKILVATDLSARCDRPMERAIALSRDRDAALTVLHVLEKHDARENPEATARERITADFPHVTDAEIVIANGSAPWVIADTARTLGSDIIITGVARYNGLGDFTLGTAVDHVIRNSTAPVLVVKQRSNRAYRNVLVATDFSPCSQQALTTAAEYFPEAQLHLVHAYHVPFEAWLDSERAREEVTAEARDQLEKFLRESSLSETAQQKMKMTLEYGETSQTIARCIRDTKADLAVLGTRGRSGLSHATIGSTAEALLSCLPIDVLMVRERQKS